ncbi:MAG: hypothetical protein MR648_03465, partial [Clostridiales bacterium]|nr:hypothetical protein [Clostridiales bacterium]
MKTRTRTRKLLSLLLTLAMVLSMIPAAVATGETATYEEVAISSAADITAGTYLISGTSSQATNDGRSSAFMSTTGSTSTRLMSADLVATDGTVQTDDADCVWNLIAADGGFYVQNVGNDKYLYYGTKTGNNIYQTADQTEAGIWTVVSNGEGWTLQETASGRQLSCNRFGSTGSYYLGFAAYANTSSTDRILTFYKLSDSATVDPGPTPTPTPSTEPTPTPDPEPTPTPTPEPEINTIAEALAGADGAKFTVKGVVTLVDGQNIYLQDETGGICVRMSSKPTDIALGDTIIGTGSKTVYNGLPQLGSGTYEKSDGLTLTAKKAAIGTLTTADICTYVKLSDVEVTEVYDNNGSYSNPNITVKDSEGKTIQLYKAVINKNEDSSWEYAVGDKINITAAVSYYKETIQLRNTLPSEITKADSIADPITDDMIGDGVLTVKEANAAAATGVTVIGQVVYHYGKAYNGTASIDSIILEDVIDGEIYGFQVYDYTNYANYKVGDIVKVTGDIAPYGGVQQMKSPTMEVVKTGVEPIPAQEITVSQMGADYLSEYVYIKDVKLGTYSASGSTTVTDATGTVNLFKGVPLPTGVTEADVTGLYACCSAYNSTYQLRNGSSADYESNVTPPGPSGGLPEAGAQVMIYNKTTGEYAHEGVLALQDANESSPSITDAAATVSGGKVTAENGGVVFTVEKNGDYYRFRNETYGYLSSNGTGNNAFYSPEASEDADWTLAAQGSGYTMESRTAKYNGKYSQYMEYYA